jgi:hypothetical protein
MSSTLSYIAITDVGAKWCLNGIDTGLGKSIIISQLAHYLASEEKEVVVLSPDMFLKGQLENKFFSKAHPAQGLIRHVAVQSSEFLQWVYKMNPVYIAKTYILVDEIDSLLSQESIRILNAPSDHPESETTLYVIDALQIIAKFNFVFGYCMVVDEASIRLVQEQNKRDAPAGTDALKVLTFNYGNCKDHGEKGYKDPVFHLRSLKSSEDMKKDTLGTVKDLLNQENGAPRCIFVVHGLTSQVSEICDAILQSPQEYKFGKRSVFMLQDTQSLTSASEFLIAHRAEILSPDGWVFISHCGVARGVDIIGIEAAAMVINFRFTNASELEQTLGGGN